MTVNDEGSVWEGAMAGPQYGLDNLTVFVDRNRLQISGTTKKSWPGQRRRTMGFFGWNVLSIPGNDMDAIDAAVDLAKRKETDGHR